MAKDKSYINSETEKDVIASEPVVTYGAVRDISINTIAKSRDNINQAITGEELLNRLRPRIKSLFA